MIFDSFPFELISENKIIYDIDKIELDTETNEWCGCTIKFYLNQKHNNISCLKRDFKVLDLFNYDRYIKKSERCQDFELYEIHDNDRIHSLSLYNGIVTEYNSFDNTIILIFDYWRILEHSVFGDLYVHITTRNEWGLENHHVILKNDINKFNNPNESVFDHNFKHSFIAYNWFKDHKITPNETLDWH